MNKISYPEYFIFELSSSCNFWCKMCYNSWKSWMDNTWEQLDFHSQIKALDMIWKFWKTVLFTWWEPTLNKNIYELIDYAKNLWLNIILITNWSTLDKEKISLLKSKWVSSIQLSFHSWNEETFNEITWTKDYYSKINKNIIESLNIFWKNNIFINVVPNKYPFDDIMNTCSNLSKLWILNITVWIPVYSWSAKNNSIIFSRKEILILYELLCKLNENLKINIMLWTSLPQCLFVWKNIKNSIVKLSSWCSIWWNAIAIWFDWGIKPCVEFNKSFGNIISDSFEDIRVSDEFNKYRNNYYVPQVCKVCKRLKKCRWWCRISAFHYSWLYDWRDPYM